MVEQIPMRLMPWNPFFLVDRHYNSNALIWCKFHRLPIEMWSKKIIMLLGKTLGTPIQLDHSTRNQDYGYHANVLVDIDLSKPIPDHILLEVENNIINKQEVLLHRVPKYCNHYKNVGHIIVKYKLVQKHFG
ncbi:hypothetical protein GIB67_002265 [Kingdonia uniflora]|uniref:DUF4283 domain-containing protein n=1 Tax=Kingdonia uniflora TaxID=39325 RepID=A0A7J7KX69_9MAGN|nr:hypothetical protein GIB67_002265 [Kingdonia uniflora]